MGEGGRATHDLDGALRRARIVTAALAAAVVVYTIIGAFITRTDSYEAPLAGDAGTLWILRGALTVVALVNFATAVYLRRVLIEGSRSLQQAPAELSPLGARLLGATVIAGAFAEAVGVYGLVLTMLGGELVDVFAFGAVAVLALASIFPKRAAWEERARSEALLGL